MSGTVWRKWIPAFFVILSWNLICATQRRRKMRYACGLALLWRYHSLSECWRDREHWIFNPIYGTQLVKNPAAMRETWIRYLGWEDPLEKGKGTHSSILAKRIPWPIVHGVTKSRMTERFSLPPDILHPSNTVHSCHSIPFLLSFSSKHLPLPDIPLYNHLPSLKHKLLKESNFCFVHRYIPCQWTNSKKHHQCG